MPQNFVLLNTEMMHHISNILRQQKVLKYVTDIGSSLRMQMDISTLLNRVAAAACEALGFRYSALYLAGIDGLFHVQATSGIPVEEEIYLRQHPLSSDIVAFLIDEKYRMSNSYFISAESPLWQNELFSKHFVIIEDEQDVLPSPLPSQLWQTADLIAIPLMSAENSLLGFLTPDAPLDGLRPDVEMMASLELLANQAAIVIEGARLYEATKQSSEERAALIEIGRALFSPVALRDLHSVYETIYEQVRRVMPVDALFVARYYRADDKLSVDYIVDEGIVYPLNAYKVVPIWARKLLLKEYKAFSFATQEEYKAFALNDIAEESPDFIGSTRASESILFASVHFGEEVLGILSVQSYTPHVYTARHVEMLQEISIQAGIAITNARLYTELREAVQRAQESEQLKNHFLMTASHELRTPLTAIQGYLELLSIHGPILNEKDRTRFVANARRASEEVILLLGNVMDTSHLNQKEIALNLGAVQLHHALIPVLDIFEPTLVSQGRKVEVTVDDSFYVHADESRLRQVLLNVLSNALKYTPIGTNMIVSAERTNMYAMTKHIPSSAFTTLSQSSQNDAPFVVVSIRDWGNGIAPKDQEQLFTKFMRLPDAVKSIQRGSGLGLYLCRQLVEAMGGAIWVESTGVPREGATFLIALPEQPS